MNVANMQAIALDQFVAHIVNRTEMCMFEESLQDAIAGVLSGLSDDKQADLYARIVSRWEYTRGWLERPTFSAVVNHELHRTNLWENE